MRVVDIECEAAVRVDGKLDVIITARNLTPAEAQAFAERVHQPALEALRAAGDGGWHHAERCARRAKHIVAIRHGFAHRLRNCRVGKQHATGNPAQERRA